jgi:phosphoribosylamine--glycine ligase
MKKNVLILGSGGREHAIAYKLKQSNHLARLYVMPGNPGISDIAFLLPGDLSDHKRIKAHIRENDIDILICGPEVPLAEGLMDSILEENWNYKPILVGPSKMGAMLESSKAFSKEFMNKYGIPTAAYTTFTKSQESEAIQYLKTIKTPIVIKASGLAAGKGVVICQDHDSAVLELKEMFHGKFGDSSSIVVIEEFLEGIEFSVFILTNGHQYILLPEAKDYKRIGVSDTGPNTGGMGAVSPVPFFNQTLIDQVEKRIIHPTLNGLSKEQIPYKGFLFLGLINVQGNPFVIEYNCRLGDPETEVILPRLKNDLIELIISMDEGKLNEVKIETDSRTAVTIMLVSAGYPDKYEKGKVIKLPEETPEESIIFHAGTQEEKHILKTNGGRVLSVTTLAPTMSSALEKSLHLANEIQFEGKYYRNDIGFDLASFKHEVE